jgi:hypothetical protein
VCFNELNCLSTSRIASAWNGPEEQEESNFQQRSPVRPCFLETCRQERTIITLATSPPPTHTHRVEISSLSQLHYPHWERFWTQTYDNSRALHLFVMVRRTGVTPVEKSAGTLMILYIKAFVLLTSPTFSRIPFVSYMLSNDTSRRCLTQPLTNNTHKQWIANRLRYISIVGYTTLKISTWNYQHSQKRDNA